MTASDLSQQPSLHEPLATTVIEPTRGWASLGLRDIWEYRELLMLLVLGAFVFRRTERTIVDVL